MKSNVSVLLSIAEAIYIDVLGQCDAVLPDKRDLKTLRSRVEHEGLSFLTITLPDFCKDLERGLEIGKIDSTAFRSFKKVGSIPAFLQGMTSQVFDQATGEIKNEAETFTAIWALRQFTLAFKKLKLPCTDARINASMQNFISVDEEVKDWSLDQREHDDFTRLCSLVWDPIVAEINPQLGYPKHGPGSTADRLLGNQKFNLTCWHDRLEPYFPMLHTIFHNENAWMSKEFERVTVVVPEGEQPVKVIAVPKTLKKPRIIAIEPTCMQFTQQQVSALIIRALKASELTKGHINFDDQEINQRLALSGSRTQIWSTLDLSDASDRVPYSIVKYMFKSNPDLWGAIDACRSVRANVTVNGDVTTHVLSKFASMGSALCFPIEAMYFYTICVLALIRKYNLPLNHSSVKYVGRMIYVYGDDIIVPRGAASAVADNLVIFNCKVNSAKSFSRGFFRESCGTDAYYGQDVTPIYVRSVAPSARENASEILSWVATSNLFHENGCWRTASTMKTVVEDIIGNLPVVGEKAACIGWRSFQTKNPHTIFDEAYNALRCGLSLGRIRVNRNISGLEYKAYVAGPVFMEDRLDSYPALLKSLLLLANKQEGEGNGSGFSKNRGWEKTQSVDPLHLERSSRYGSVTLKRRWTRPY